LSAGTYAVVKEAVHISTGKYYACKVINKRLMEGREHMVRILLVLQQSIIWKDGYYPIVMIGILTRGFTLHK
jgi:serine/threonine protein kinase